MRILHQNTILMISFLCHGRSWFPIVLRQYPTRMGSHFYKFPMKFNHNQFSEKVQALATWPNNSLQMQNRANKTKWLFSNIVWLMLNNKRKFLQYLLWHSTYYRGCKSHCYTICPHKSAIFLMISRTCERD
jgi:hypothetical protein